MKATWTMGHNLADQGMKFQYDQQWLVLLHQFQNLFQLKKNKTQASAPDENIIDGLGYMNPSYDPPSYADALK